MNNRIVVASRNPVKLAAVQAGFQRMFPDAQFEVLGLDVPSGVSDQPSSDDETLRGARNRATHARQAQPDAGYWVGVEGGVIDDGQHMQSFAWIVVLSSTHSGRGRTATFFLPDEVSALVREGHELGDADDIVFNRSNSKQDNGAIGILTHDVITRETLYIPAVAIALIPFVNPDLTFSG